MSANHANFTDEEMPNALGRPQAPSRADDCRPRLCIGADATHTPDRLVEAARTAFQPVGDALVNEPFRGSFVPLTWYGTDPRVESIMLEIGRDTYLVRAINDRRRPAGRHDRSLRRP